MPDLNAQSALELDARDPLAAFAGEFLYPRDADGRRLVYLCGHSLGLQTKSTREYVAQELSDWERLAVLGHHAAKRPWVGYHELAAAGGYQYDVINDNMDQAVQDICDILTSQWKKD